MDGQDTKTSSKVIAQFHIVDTISPVEQFLEDYHQCPLCGTEMVFTHVTNFVNEEVKEEAHCSPCQIRVKSNQHQLQ
jgi:transcription elongation factor Elf1